jgi:hypothetical protein
MIDTLVVPALAVLLWFWSSLGVRCVKRRDAVVLSAEKLATRPACVLAGSRIILVFGAASRVPGSLQIIEAINVAKKFYPKCRYLLLRQERQPAPEQDWPSGLGVPQGPVVFVLVPRKI